MPYGTYHGSRLQDLSCVSAKRDSCAALFSGNGFGARNQEWKLNDFA